MAPDRTAPLANNIDNSKLQLLFKYITDNWSTITETDKRKWNKINIGRKNSEINHLFNVLKDQGIDTFKIINTVSITNKGELQVDLSNEDYNSLFTFPGNFKAKVGLKNEVNNTTIKLVFVDKGNDEVAGYFVRFVEESKGIFIPYFKQLTTMTKAEFNNIFNENSLFNLPTDEKFAKWVVKSHRDFANDPVIKKEIISLKKQHENIDFDIRKKIAHNAIKHIEGIYNKKIIESLMVYRYDNKVFCRRLRGPDFEDKIITDQELIATLNAKNLSNSNALIFYKLEGYGEANDFYSFKITFNEQNIATVKEAIVKKNDNSALGITSFLSSKWQEWFRVNNAIKYKIERYENVTSRIINEQFKTLDVLSKPSSSLFATHLSAVEKNIAEEKKAHIAFLSRMTEKITISRKIATNIINMSNLPIAEEARLIDRAEKEFGKSPFIYQYKFGPKKQQCTLYDVINKKEIYSFNGKNMINMIQQNFLTKSNTFKSLFFVYDGKPQSPVEIFIFNVGTQKWDLLRSYSVADLRNGLKNPALFFASDVKNQKAQDLVWSFTKNNRTITKNLPEKVETSNVSATDGRKKSPVINRIQSEPIIKVTKKAGSEATWLCSTFFKNNNKTSYIVERNVPLPVNESKQLEDIETEIISNNSFPQNIENIIIQFDKYDQTFLRAIYIDENNEEVSCSHWFDDNARKVVSDTFKNISAYLDDQENYVIKPETNEGSKIWNLIHKNTAVDSNFDYPRWGVIGTEKNSNEPVDISFKQDVPPKLQEYLAHLTAFLNNVLARPEMKELDWGNNDSYQFRLSENDSNANARIKLEIKNQEVYYEVPLKTADSDSLAQILAIIKNDKDWKSYLNPEFGKATIAEEHNIFDLVMEMNKKTPENTAAPSVEQPPFGPVQGPSQPSPFLERNQIPFSPNGQPQENLLSRSSSLGLLNSEQSSSFNPENSQLGPNLERNQIPFSPNGQPQENLLSRSSSLGSLNLHQSSSFISPFQRRKNVKRIKKSQRQSSAFKWENTLLGSLNSLHSEADSRLSFTDLTKNKEVHYQEGVFLDKISEHNNFIHIIKVRILENVSEKEYNVEIIGFYNENGNFILRPKSHNIHKIMKKKYILEVDQNWVCPKNNLQQYDVVKFKPNDLKLDDYSPFAFVTEVTGFDFDNNNVVPIVNLCIYNVATKKLEILKEVNINYLEKSSTISFIPETQPQEISEKEMKKLKAGDIVKINNIGIDSLTNQVAYVEEVEGSLVYLVLITKNNEKININFSKLMTTKCLEKISTPITNLKTDSAYITNNPDADSVFFKQFKTNINNSSSWAYSKDNDTKYLIAPIPNNEASNEPTAGKVAINKLGTEMYIISNGKFEDLFRVNRQNESFAVDGESTASEFIGASGTSSQENEANSESLENHNSIFDSASATVKSEETGDNKLPSTTDVPIYSQVKKPKSPALDINKDNDGQVNEFENEEEIQKNYHVDAESSDRSASPPHNLSPLSNETDSLAAKVLENQNGVKFDNEVKPEVNTEEKEPPIAESSLQKDGVTNGNSPLASLAVAAESSTQSSINGVTTTVTTV